MFSRKNKITNIDINIDKNSTVKEVYFTSCYANLCSDKEYAKGVIAHAPDTLFNKMVAAEYSNYGKITDGKRWAYLKSIYPDFIRYFLNLAYLLTSTSESIGKSKNIITLI